jgi:hypothetical protein
MWILFVLIFLPDGNVWTAEQRFGATPASAKACYEASLRAATGRPSYVAFARCEQESGHRQDRHDASGSGD